MKYLNQKIENESKKENKMNYKDKAIRCVRIRYCPCKESNLKNVATV